MEASSFKLVKATEEVERRIMSYRYPISRGEVEEFVDEVTDFIPYGLSKLVLGCSPFWPFDASKQKNTYTFINGRGDHIVYFCDFDMQDDICTNTFTVDTDNGQKRAETLINLLQIYAQERGFKPVQSIRPWELKVV